MERESRMPMRVPERVAGVLGICRRLFCHVEKSFDARWLALVFTIVTGCVASVDGAADGDKIGTEDAAQVIANNGSPFITPRLLAAILKIENCFFDEREWRTLETSYAPKDLQRLRDEFEHDNFQVNSPIPLECGQDLYGVQLSAREVSADVGLYKTTVGRLANAAFRS